MLVQLRAPRGKQLFVTSAVDRGRERARTDEQIVVGSREQLLHLLAEAAEIEHTLMCTYLYAAFSLKRRGEAGLSEEQGDAVERWRKAIMGVAVEEMGHLLMVANLSLAVGGRPHFARPNFPVAPGYFPSDVTVRLSGFSEETLDHFIYLERPGGVDIPDAEAFDQADYSRTQAYRGLMPYAQDYGTIGHLYEAVRVNLTALAEHLGSERLFVGGVTGQLGAPAIEMEGVCTIADLAEALRAIDVIVEQGEGSPADREDSHYRSFMAVQDELRRLREADPAFEPAWPVADNPVLRKPPARGDMCYIDHPDSARMLDLGCATYGLLLRVLGQSFGRSGQNATREVDQLLEVAFELMHVLGTAGDALARLPASDGRSEIHAGLTFTMLRAVEPLRGGVEQAVLQEQLAAIAAAAEALPQLAGRAASLRDLACSFAEPAAHG